MQKMLEIKIQIILTLGATDGRHRANLESHSMATCLH